MIGIFQVIQGLRRIIMLIHGMAVFNGVTFNVNSSCQPHLGYAKFLNLINLVLRCASYLFITFK